ncbi:winged helix-turn-helix domain-containing protein [Clostridium tyrobutyricum]|nr:hypothetical protein [Clostridium tyrobutyricum]
MISILNYSDGSNSLVDIARRSNINFYIIK